MCVYVGTHIHPLPCPLGYCGSQVGPAPHEPMIMTKMDGNDASDCADILCVSDGIGSVGVSVPYCRDHSVLGREID